VLQAKTGFVGRIRQLPLPATRLLPRRLCKSCLPARHSGYITATAQAFSLVGCMLVSLMLMRIVGVVAHCCYEDVATTCSAAVPCHAGWLCMIVALDNFSLIRA
jgi:hypothetical protein